MSAREPSDAISLSALSPSSTTSSSPPRVSSTITDDLPRKRVRKRDGSTVELFDPIKITEAIRRAWLEVEGRVDGLALQQVVRDTTRAITVELADVEAIQNLVENALMQQRPRVAEAYRSFRERRASKRRYESLRPDSSAISDYIHYGKYARYREDLGRREVYEETVARVEDMHLRRFAHIDGLAEEINWAFDLVREKRVLPSMRSMQFGGKAIEANNARLFNCSATLIDRPRVFAETIYLLLCGCGVGYSVQYDHVDKLPPLKFIDRKKIVHHVVQDSIEGWANALDALVNSYFKSGVYVEFSYHLIRPAGSPLITSGGRAPGHMQLKAALEKIREVFDGAQGRRLRPIEAHDALCHAADAVLSGGIRRSAMISFFSPDDSEMMYAKTGNWYSKAPWRSNANNSVSFLREEMKRKQFERVFQMTREFGDPGFYFTSHRDQTGNPCNEIAMMPVLTYEDGNQSTGYSFCNLVEINAARFECFEDYKRAAKAATLIGTLQASYTDFPYLGSVTEAIARRDALLGVSMTGMMDSPRISCNPMYQREIALSVKDWNEAYALRIGVNSAARSTCVKPAGTSSLELKGVASGHHPHHAKRYIRRVIADEHETVFQAFRDKNSHMCVRRPDGKFVIEFAVAAPDGAIVKDDLTAIEFLEKIRSTQQNWVVPGTREDRSQGMTHNVSNTVVVKSYEWQDVINYIWEHRADFSGISLLASTADKDFAFAPHEKVETEADERRWSEIVINYKPIDYRSDIIEDSDQTTLSGELACAGGACAIV